MELATLQPLLPELLLACCSMILLLWGAIAGDKSYRLVTIFSGAALAGTFATLFVVDPAPVLLLGGHVGSDRFALFLKALMLVGAFATLITGFAYNQRHDLARPELPVLMLLATLGMLLMASAASMLGLYVALELQSLSLYVLAALRRDSAKSSEAGLKYFVLGALASGLLLYGISLIYGATGSVTFVGIHAALATGAVPVGVLLGAVFVVVALAFKIAAVPFHMWSPDVYEGAPTSVTAFFTAVPGLAGFALLIRVLELPLVTLQASLQPILVVLALLSMLLGAFAALKQNNLKRLMAYSSIGHVGYALLGLVAGGAAGVQATLLYLLIYVPMTVGAFAFILSLRRDDVYLEQVSDLAGLSKTRPALAAIMSLIMFSMIGVPPLAGFFGKLNVLLAAVQAGYVWLAVAGVLASVVAAFYYLRLVKTMYFDAAPPGARFAPIPGWGMGAVLGASTVFLLGFIVRPDLATLVTQQAAQALFPV